MRTTVDLPDELFHRLKERALQEELSLKLLLEKSGYEYLKTPLKRLPPEEIDLPLSGDGTGKVIADPATWWSDLNERS